MTPSIRLRLGIGLAAGLLLVMALQWLAVTHGMRTLADELKAMVGRFKI